MTRQLSSFVKVLTRLLISTVISSAAFAFSNGDSEDGDGGEGGGDWEIQQLRCKLIKSQPHSHSFKDQENPSIIQVSDLKDRLKNSSGWIETREIDPSIPDLYHVVIGYLPGLDGDPEESVKAAILGESSRWLSRYSENFSEAIETEREIYIENGRTVGRYPLAASIKGDLPRLSPNLRSEYTGITLEAFAGPVYRRSDLSSFQKRYNIPDFIQPEGRPRFSRTPVSEIEAFYEKVYAALPDDADDLKIDRGRALLINSDQFAALIHFDKNEDDGQSTDLSTGTTRIYFCPHDRLKKVENFTASKVSAFFKGVAGVFEADPSLLNFDSSVDSRSAQAPHASASVVNTEEHNQKIVVALKQIAELSVAGQLVIVPMVETHQGIISLVSDGIQAIQNRVDEVIKEKGFSALPVVAGSALLYAATQRFPALRYAMINQNSSTARGLNLGLGSSIESAQQNQIVIAEIAEREDLTASFAAVIERGLEFSKLSPTNYHQFVSQLTRDQIEAVLRLSELIESAQSDRMSELCSNPLISCL